MFKSFKNFLVLFFNRNSEENIYNYIICNENKKIDSIIYEDYKKHIDRMYYVSEY